MKAVLVSRPGGPEALDVVEVAEPAAGPGQVQIRAEAFNAFNHPSFSAPNTSVTSSAFGRVTADINLPRIVQFGIKVVF